MFVYKDYAFVFYGFNFSIRTRFYPLHIIIKRPTGILACNGLRISLLPIFHLVPERTRVLWLTVSHCVLTCRTKKMHTRIRARPKARTNHVSSSLPFHQSQWSAVLPVTVRLKLYMSKPGDALKRLHLKNVKGREREVGLNRLWRVEMLLWVCARARASVMWLTPAV